MIALEGINKIFRLPHDRKHTLRQRFVSIFQKSTYEELYALRDINLKVSRGEFLGIIGKNGSGKSTLLKLVAKVLEPTSGTICVDGNVAPFLELGVGFQGDLTVKDNISLYGALLGMSRREIDQKYDWIIDFSGLERFVDAKLKNLSSGMQVRLGFSITVSVESPILLVDEVLAVGDIDFQQKCYDSFEDFKKAGRTILFVSHDLAAVERFCDRVILLENGHIIKEGPAPEVSEFYRKVPISNNITEKKQMESEQKLTMPFPESALAHKYCVGKGLEIGGSIFNPFGLNTLNVDITDSMDTVFKQEEIRQCGRALKVDIVASGDDIPLPDESQDFIVSSHVIEHFTNPIKALIEWDRLIKPGGIIFMIVPHKERTFDKERENTPLKHIIQDFKNGIPLPNNELVGHEHVWITETFVELIQYMINVLEMKWQIVEVQDIDDKAGNGFTVVIRKLSLHTPDKSTYIQKSTYQESLSYQNELEATRRELQLIYNSHGWKLLKFYYKLRDKMLPNNTKRRAAAKFCWKTLNRIISFFSRSG